MIRSWSLIAGWYHAVSLAALPWVAAWRPHWAPLVAVMAVVVYPEALRSRAAEPWASGLVAISPLVFLAVFGGSGVVVGWLVLAFVVLALAWSLPVARWGRPDASDAAALVGWATMLAARPQLMDVNQGGWIAPAVLLLATRRLAGVVPRAARRYPQGPLPPTREARGTVSLRGVVAVSSDGIPGTVPLDVELRAGDSLAILCDTPSERQMLADLFSGRQLPGAGEVTIDGMPLGEDDRLVAVVSLGERFVVGDLEANVAALADEPLDRDTLTAVREACGLDEVAEELRGGAVSADGAPLEPLHRLLLLTARVIPSHYRVLVVVDPMPWVNPVRGHRWRNAVVRASVGRTGVWITADRDLASRASRVLEFRQGALRPVDVSSDLDG